MSEIDVSKCKYYSNIYKDKYGNNFFNYCHLYEDKCDKYPQCIYRDKQLQQLKAENEELKDSVTSARIELDKQKSRLKKHIAKLEQECEKWKSYYELYRIETDIVKKVQAVINGNPKYGIEFTENGIINKDERLSYLEIHEQIKLIIDEQAKELYQLKAENEVLKNTINKLGIEHENYDNLIYWQMKEQQDKLKAENEELKKKLKTIYDILDMCENGNCSDCKYEDCYDCTSLNRNDILQLIKQAKEGE